MSMSLEEELGLPHGASLSQSPAWLLQTAQGSGAISISLETSLRNKAETPLCLLVGRQASTADIRIQHGSISRKHAVFYYVNGDLFLKDLGGKHGTHVNNKRLDDTPTKLKNGDSIYFGNVQASSFIVKEPENRNDATKKEPADGADGVAVEEATTSAGQEQRKEEPGEGLTGRAKREAEIAAMMASLDEKPSYEKYTAPKQPQEQQRQSQQQSQAAMLANKYSIPLSERFDILNNDGDKKRVITSMAVDSAGSRFAVGGTDTHLQLYDFAGMTQLHTHAFKTIEVEEGHLVVDVCYSNTGDRLLVATGSVQPKVLDRDGNEM